VKILFFSGLCVCVCVCVWVCVCVGGGFGSWAWVRFSRFLWLRSGILKPGQRTHSKEFIQKLIQKNQSTTQSFFHLWTKGSEKILLDHWTSHFSRGFRRQKICMSAVLDKQLSEMTAYCHIILLNGLKNYRCSPGPLCFFLLILSYCNSSIIWHNGLHMSWVKGYRDWCKSCLTMCGGDWWRQRRWWCEKAMRKMKRGSDARRR
jgi:hypothetical protein